MSGMVPTQLPVCHETELIRADGRPSPAFRERLRRIPSWRNAWSVVFLYVQTGAVVWASAQWGPWIWPLSVLLMGRAFAQFASLMHEAAHRLLFSHRPSNDLVGRWLLGFPSFTSTDVYRRVHMAHHRDEFGPDEPDIPLYIGYPIPRDSFRRKLMRDATGRTGIRLMRQLLSNARSNDPRSRRTLWKILGVQAVLLAAAVLSGHWWLYPLLWLLSASMNSVSMADSSLRRYQALGIGQGVIDEISGMRYMAVGADPYDTFLGPNSAESATGRSAFNDLDDYNAYSEQPLKEKGGQSLGNENGDGSTRDPNFRVPSTYFTRWRMQTSVYYVNEGVWTTALSNTSPTSYRTLQVKIQYNDPTLGYIDLANLVRTFAYVPEP